MAPVSRPLIALLVVFGVMTQMSATQHDAPWSNWTLPPPENCPHEDPVSHVCSTLHAMPGVCLSVVCCHQVGPHDELAAPEHSHEDDDVTDEREDEHCDSLCIVVRNCTISACVSDCCDGFRPDVYGTCRNETRQVTCENGGTPQRYWDGSGFYCSCRPGFTGATCQKPYCGCMNNGSCVVEYGQPVCKCPTGFIGRVCEQQSCGLPCHNGGRCVQDGNRQVCNCTAPYIGQYCETKFEQSSLCPPLQRYPTGGDCRPYCYEDADCAGASVCCWRDACSRSCHKPTPAACTRDGRTFKLGERYKPDPCTECECLADGEMACMVYDCAFPVCEDGSQPKRKDDQCCPVCQAGPTIPPRLTCPRYPVNVEVGRGQCGVHLTPDNTGVVAYDQQRRRVKVYFEPEDVKHCRCRDPRERYHRVEAYAKNRNGTAKCAFTVHLRDTEPPRVVSCPQDVYVYEGERVTWLDPVVRDNVGLALNKSSPDLKTIRDQKLRAGNYTVAYSFYDFDRNVAVCRFNVGVFKHDTPWHQLPLDMRERSREQKDDSLNIGLVVGPILGALGVFALIVAVGICMRTRRAQQSPPPATPAPRQPYDNHIYHVPADVKPPPYSLPANPPPYASGGDMKEAEYAYLAPPPAYSVSGSVGEGVSNPQYSTIGSKSDA